MRDRRTLALAIMALSCGGIAPHTGMAHAGPALDARPGAAIFAGLQGGGIYRSLDGGASWQEADTGIPSGTDVTALAASAVGTLYAGTNGAGVFISTDRGQSWQADNNGSSGLDSADIVGLATNPQYREDVYAAARNGNVYVSYSSGQSWYSPQNVAGSQLTALVDDARQPNILLAGTSGAGIYRSTEYPFRSWSAAGGDISSASVNSIAFDPRDANTAYAATDQGIFQSMDAGSSWQAVGSDSLNGADLRSVAVDPQDSTHLVAGDSAGRIYVSTDSGSSWQIAANDNTSSVNAIVFDQAHAGALAGTADAGLYRSKDDGQIWQTANPSGFGSSAVLALIAGGRPALPTDPVPAATNSAFVRYFPETHHILRAAFISFFDKYGGIKVFGLPLTEEFVEGGQLVQYFERMRLAQKGNTVQISPLGRQVTAGRSFPPVSPFASSGTRLYFSSTGHSLSGKFLTFWQTHHGAFIYGSPISEPLREQNGDGTGRTYLVQYLQNGRLEYHPELSGTRYEIQPGQLGRQVLKARGWL